PTSSPISSRSIAPRRRRRPRTSRSHNNRGRALAPSRPRARPCHAGRRHAPRARARRMPASTTACRSTSILRAPRISRACRAAGVGVAALVQGRHAVAPLPAAVARLGVRRAEPPPLPPEHVGRLPLPLTARLAARLDGEPVVWAADRARLVLDVERVDGVVRTGRVALTVYGPPPSLADGQRIAVEARLDRPVGFRDPGVFDATVRMAREGVFVMGSAPSTRVVPLEPAAPSWPARVRRFALAAFAERLPPVSAGLLSGLVLGSRTALPADVQDAFRSAGV